MFLIHYNLLKGDEFMNQFEDTSFDIKEYINVPTLEKLNRIAIYLYYSLLTTIKKQMPEINEQDEKLYAKELLNNYFKGDIHSFTSKNNIRNNIYTIGIDNLINLFLKSMIEKHAYNILIKHMEGSSEYRDQCANYITNRIGKNHYDDIIEWLKKDYDNIEEIIENYVDFVYKKSYNEHHDLDNLVSKNYETNRAFKMLNIK